MVAKKAKPRGRPRRYLGDRPNWTIRLEEKYGGQIREIAEQSGRSISEVCEQQIVNSFRLQMICDMLEQKEKNLTEELRDSERRAQELTQRLDLLMRVRATKSRFGRPVRDRSKFGGGS
jgi:hypothetical protein